MQNATIKNALIYLTRVQMIGTESSKKVSKQGATQTVEGTTYWCTDTGYQAGRAKSGMESVRTAVYDAALRLGTGVNISGMHGILINEGEDEKKMDEILVQAEKDYLEYKAEFLAAYPDAVMRQCANFPGDSQKIQASAPSVGAMEARIVFEHAKLKLANVGFSDSVLEKAIQSFPMAAAKEIATIVRQSVQTPFASNPQDALKARERWNKKVFNAGPARELLESLIEKIDRVAVFHKTLALWPKVLKDRLALLPEKGRLVEDLNAEMKALYEHMLNPENLLAGPPAAPVLAHVVAVAPDPVATVIGPNGPIEVVDLRDEPPSDGAVVPEVISADAPMSDDELSVGEVAEESIDQSSPGAFVW